MAFEDLISGPPDTEGLGYDYRDGVWIGYIESVNGGQSRCCELFDPSIFELLVLAKHWYRKLLSIKASFESTDVSCGTQWRTLIYAERRLERIRQHVGDELFNETLNQVDGELAA